MRNLVVKISILFLCLNFISGCRFFTEQNRNKISPMPFEKQKWDFIPSVPDDSKYRPRMARELVNNNLLIGKTRAEVFEMLGGEEQKGKVITYKLEEIYEFLNIDPIAIELLSINFSDEDRVKKAEIELHKTRYW